MGRRILELERALRRPAFGAFSEAELAGLPGPVARYFRGAIAPATPLAQTARITMRGRIRLRSWTRFSGTEVISPGAGFVWSARAGAISGYDRYVDGEGEMRWKLLGLLPIVHATGPDVGRSAVARAAGEGVWIPTGILPRFGVAWAAIDDTHIVSRHRVDGHELEYLHTLDDQARIAVTSFERWGDPDSTGAHDLHPFGIETTAHRTFGGLTIPAAGRAGWHYGTDRWPAGIFFEYQIIDVRVD